MKEKNFENKKKIFIGIPSRNAVGAELNGRLAILLKELSNNKRYKIIVQITSGFPVERVRNLIVNDFLKTDYEYLLMIDDDIVPPQNVLEMADYEKDIIGGLYYGWLNDEVGPFSIAYKSDPSNPANYKFLGIGDIIENQGVMEVGLLGTGCMMVHRNVFEKLKPPYFRMELDEEHITLLTPEDFYFCKKARENGFKVFLDTGIVCGHVKNLDLQKVVRWAQNYMEKRSFFDFLK